MNYAIFRSEPIKNIPDLAQVGAHNDREKKAYDSNPDIDILKSSENIEIIPLNAKSYTKKFHEITKEYELEHNERMKTERSERRKTFNQMVNSSQNVVADNLIFNMTNSDYVKKLDKEDLIKYGNVCKDFVIKDLGYKPEQIIQMVMHNDEKTPHIHCTVVPLVRKFDKRTNTERYTISKKQYIRDKIHLSQLQDKFHQRLLDAGFEVDRGIKGSDKEHLSVKEFKKITNYNLKQLEAKDKSLTEAVNKLEDDMKSNKEIIFDKNHVKVSKETFEDIKNVIHESKKVIDMQPNLEMAFDKMTMYNKSLSNLERENKHLQKKNDKLEEHNKSLINMINKLLETLAKLFRKVLHIGDDKDKDETETSIKNIYDKSLYSKWEVSDIAKGTSKEVPLKIYVGLLPKNYYHIKKESVKSLKKLNSEMDEAAEEFYNHKNKDDDLSL